MCNRLHRDWHLPKSARLCVFLTLRVVEWKEIEILVLGAELNLT